MKKIFALTIMLVITTMMVGCEDETTKPKEIQRGTLTENIEVENIEVETIEVNGIEVKPITIQDGNTTYWAD